MPLMAQEISTHWADITADKIIREKGEKEVYTCASGITPSGTVHIGNFREIISVDLVVKALRNKGKKVRFIYSWDDYDVFRKVPANMPQKELLETFIRKPIVVVPDVVGSQESYARANEVAVETLLPKVGIQPEYLHQAARYRSSYYAQGIRTALEHRKEIMEILNEFRTEPLADDWMPVSVFSGFTGKDTTTVTAWDGEWGVTYRDDETGESETVDLRKTSLVKLPWRIDWPMRWAQEGVDFEPAGKDHHSQGGSFDTSKRVCELFGTHAPVSFKYDFITFKGKGKQSSSKGNVDTLEEVLRIYTPEVTRYMFASTRPNAEFNISFDLDVLKIYEDYDNCERIYFGILPVNEKRFEKEKRIFELSQVGEIPTEASYQIPFRHLCNLLQIFDGDIDAVISRLGDVKPSQIDRLKAKCACAWAWIQEDAPDDFKFSLIKDDQEIFDKHTEAEKAAIRDLAVAVEEDQDLSVAIYDIAAKNGLENTAFFAAVYQALIKKEKGPKLVQFIKSCDKARVVSILKRY